mmetsp:Transcript_6317/g.16145  ORF Transcript_6317/g.16145 Transcript_6317/m.16145 type:complete len:141 (+) Transcript_6317:420-842(+)
MRTCECNTRARALGVHCGTAVWWLHLVPTGSVVVQSGTRRHSRCHQIVCDAWHGPPPSFASYLCITPLHACAARSLLGQLRQGDCGAHEQHQVGSRVCGRVRTWSTAAGRRSLCPSPIAHAVGIGTARPAREPLFVCVDR